MILKFSNLAVHLVTNETTSRADSLIFIHDHIKRLSGCCQHSTVLKHSYHAVLHTYQCPVTPPSFHLVCLSTSVVTKTSSSLRPRPITGEIQTNNHQKVTVTKYNLNKWLKIPFKRYNIILIYEGTNHCWYNFCFFAHIHFQNVCQMMFLSECRLENIVTHY